jgi:dihydroflavonol-4-reductase
MMKTMQTLDRSARPAHGPCLVTGGTGLVGNNVIRMLLDAGHPVRALVRGGPGGRPLAGLDVAAVAGDVTDREAVQRAVDGVATVVHSAAMVHVGWRHLEQMRQVNVEGTRHVAAAARRAGARLVHVSSVDALGLTADGAAADEETPSGGMVECPYVVTKREAERVVLEEVERGLDAVIVNPVFMLGPWDWKPSSGRMLLEVGSGRGILAPPGSNDFVDVRDVAAGIIAALAAGRTGRRYILGGHPLRYVEAWRIFAATAGRRPPRGEAPPRVVRFAGRVGDLLAGIVGREGPVNSAATGMSMLRHNFNCDRARHELGYTIRPLERTVAETWAWFVANGYAKDRRTAATGTGRATAGDGRGHRAA